MPITALYAALLVPLYLLLAIRVIGVRRGTKVAVGDGGNALLMRRMRVQANFAEYVPFTLLLMALAESLGTPAWVVHALGVVLLCGRLLHAFGMSQAEEKFAFRVAGVVSTFSMLAIAAIACLHGALAHGIGL